MTSSVGKPYWGPVVVPEVKVIVTNVPNRQGMFKLIKTTEMPEKGKLAVNINNVLNIPKSKEDCENSYNWFQNTKVIPIVIDPNGYFNIREMITNGEQLEYCVNPRPQFEAGYRAVIIHPSQFSLAFIKAIVEGKIKENDLVNVEVFGESKTCNKCHKTHCFEHPKLRSDGTAIITKHKPKTYTENEVKSLLHVFGLENNIFKLGPTALQNVNSFMSRTKFE